MSGLFGVLNEIKNSPDLSFYYSDCFKFFDYLQQVQFLSIKAMYGFKDGSISESEFEVVYRWSETYRRSIMAKFYKLQEWFEQNPQDVTFLTLTASSKNRTIEDCFRILIDSRTKLMKVIRRIIKHKFDYVWVFEPHESGHPHIHMILFKKLNSDEQIHLRHLWEKYEAGSFEHGLDFEVREHQENIRNLKNYLISYLGKSWTDTGSKYKKQSWTKEQFIYNMVAWKNQFRFWGCSRALSKVMAYVPDEILKYNPKVCYRTIMKDTYDNLAVGEIWKADDKLLSNLKEKYEKWHDKAMGIGFGS